MHSDSQFRALVGGQWRGPLACALRSVLALAERPYRWIVQARNRRFDQGRGVRRVAAPVVSVGNLTVGGTGKTPLVAWLARWFLQRQIEVTIISRGYGSRRGRPNDEALELAACVPGVSHVQRADRVRAAEEALLANPRQILLLDDAFQHRRLARDLDIVLLDALEPFGYEHLLPRGLLREPVASLARAQVIALSRSDAVEESRCREIERRVREVAPQALWLELAHRSVGFVTADGQLLDLTALRGQSIAAVCGIGNPAGFRHTLAQCGLAVAGFLELPDHCGYSGRDLGRIEQWLRAFPQVQSVICTRKDLVKIPRGELAGKRLWALEIELQIVRGQSKLESRLIELCKQDVLLPR